MYALAVDSSGTLYAGGAFTTAGGVNANSVARWDGTNWNSLAQLSGGLGMNNTVTDLAPDSADRSAIA